MWQLDNWKCYLVVWLFFHLPLCTSVVSATPINSFSIPHAHTHRGTQNASFMHLSLFYTSYFAFQGRRTALDFSTASMLSHWFPITLELFWHEADYTSTALTMSLPLPSPLSLFHTLASHSVVHIGLFLSTCICVSLLFASIFVLFFFLMLWHAECVSMWVYVRGREIENMSTHDE